MTRTASRLVAVAALGGLLFGYETGVAGGGLNDARDLSYFSNDSLLLLGTATLIGALIGSLAGGKLSDTIGRRDVIMATAALFTLGAFSSALAPSLDALFVARLVVGLAVGAISVAAPLYIAELAPPRSRGAFVATFQLAITLGLFSAYVLRNMFHAFPEGWRYTLGVGAVLGILLSGAALLLDELPLWLELEDGQENPALSLLGDGTSKRGDALQTLFSLAGRRGLFLCVALFFFQQFVGINAVLYFASTILSDLDFSFGLGFRPGDALPFAIVNVAMSAVAIALIDGVGRRPLLLFSFVASAAGLLVVAFGMILHIQRRANRRHDSLAAGCFVFVGGFALGIGPVPWVILSESFPIGLRGLLSALPPRPTGCLMPPSTFPSAWPTGDHARVTYTGAPAPSARAAARSSRHRCVRCLGLPPTPRRLELSRRASGRAFPTALRHPGQNPRGRRAPSAPPPG